MHHPPPPPAHEVSIALCGIGGYGEWYLKALLADHPARPFRLVAVIDPYPELCSQLPKIKAARIPLFENLEAFYSKMHCDLLILATPIHLHCQQTCQALAQGSHVLCEKPLCVSLDQIKLMERAQATTGKIVTIGYQWSFSRAIRKLKQDRLNGRFGDARRLRTIVCWPRDEYYYQRNEWAGRRQLEPDTPILDSPVNNAAAHYLHNMLYLMGREMSLSALPLQVEAELWRANAIENYDTAALRIKLEPGCEALFFTSHATKEIEGPSFVYEFDRAVVEFDAKSGNILAHFRDGGTIDYGSPEADPYEKIWHAVETARTNQPSICGIAAAAAHAICVNWAQSNSGGVHDFPKDLIVMDRSERSAQRYVKGLQEILSCCYKNDMLLSENEEFVGMTETSGVDDERVEARCRA
jgi:predicted dehydrogenase